MKTSKLTIIASLAILVVSISCYLYTEKQNNYSIAQDNEEACRNLNIQGIKKHAQVIEAGKANYASSTRYIFGESTQGGHQSDYRLNNEIVLREQVFFGETGRSEASYYLEDDKVFYFTKKNIEYINSIYQDHSGAVKKIDIKDFYFDKNQELCLWYLNQKIQPNDQDTADLIKYLLSGL